MNDSFILVTGGAGFIGSTLIDKLVKEGKKIICIDNFDPFYPKHIKENNIQSAIQTGLCTFIEGDIRDKEAIHTIFSKYPINMVVHLAAKAGVRPSIYNTEEYYDVNLNGTLCLMEAMKKFNVKKLIYASSSSVYGNNKKTPYSETDNIDFPISPYASSKKSGELLTHVYHNLYGIDVINLRFFTVYGPRQRPDLAIHRFFAKIYAGEPIDFYGDGSTSRDYTYVNDIVDGLRAAMDFVKGKTGIYETINLGNSDPVTLNELVKLVEEVAQKQLVKNKLPMQEGDVNLTYADISKARRILNYNPATKIKDGLTQFKKWYEETHRPR